MVIYKCNHCGEIFPYQPVMCNDCGASFSFNTFTVMQDTVTRRYLSIYQVKPFFGINYTVPITVTFHYADTDFERTATILCQIVKVHNQSSFELQIESPDNIFLQVLTSLD